MVSRRTFLSTLGAAALAGCLGDDDGDGDADASPTPDPDGTPTRTGSDGDDDETPEHTRPPTTTPEYWPPDDWSPAWSLGVDRTHVTDIRVAGDVAYVAAIDPSGSEMGETTVAALPSESREFDWTASLPGETVAQSQGENARPNPPAVLVDGDSLLVVTGDDTGGRWNELSMLDRTSGDRQWSLRRDRRFDVLGVRDGVVYALARAFRRRTTDHYHGTDTPTPTPRDATLLAVDRSNGTVRWSREFRGVKAGAVGPESVFLGVMNELVALDHGGNRRWRYRGTHPTHSVFPADGGAYFLTQPDWGRLVAHGVDAGESERWRSELHASRSATYDGDLFVGGDRFGRFAPDGSVVWRTQEYAQWMVFAPADDRVYTRTGAMADAVGAYGLADGERAWTFDPPISNAWPETASADVVVAGGIGDQGRPLYRVDPDDGVATGRYLNPEREVSRATVFGDVVLGGTGDYDEGGEVLAFPIKD